MVYVSRTLFSIFNGILLLVGLAVIGLGLYDFIAGNSACEKDVGFPLMVTGAALFVISLIGLIGSCFRANFVLMIYLFFMFVLILGFLVFTIFVILVTSEGSGKALSKVKITYFQGWLRRHFVENDKNWNGIKNCLIDANICGSLDGHYKDKLAADFFKQNLSPLQSGCCKPPSKCGYVSQNATFWVRPEMVRADLDTDCAAWSNQQQTLCYNCESCKAGVVDTIRKKWKILAIIHALIIVIALVVYSVGCYASRSNDRDKGYKRYRGRYP